MERRNLMTEVYEELCKKFLYNIPDEKKKEYETAYLTFLHNEYDSYFEEANSEDLNSIACFCVTKEKIVQDKKTFRDKEAMLFPDEEYKVFENLCLKISDMARRKILGEKIEPERSYEEYKNMLMKLFNKVGNLFKYTAERMLSEALVDLETIFINSNIRSFRNKDYN